MVTTWEMMEVVLSFCDTKPRDVGNTGLDEPPLPPLPEPTVQLTGTATEATVWEDPFKRLTLTVQLSVNELPEIPDGLPYTVRVTPPLAVMVVVLKPSEIPLHVPEREADRVPLVLLFTLTELLTIVVDPREDVVRVMLPGLTVRPLLLLVLTVRVTETVAEFPLESVTVTVLLWAPVDSVPRTLLATGTTENTPALLLN